MYNVTMRGLCETIAAVEKQSVLHILSVCVCVCVCVFVDLGTQHVMHMRHIAICGLSGSTIFSPRFLKKGTIFGKTRLSLKRLF